MMTAWLVLGAMVGAALGLVLGGQAMMIFSNAVAGMIVFPLIGLPLGLIGGRASESLIGAAAGTVFGVALGGIAGQAITLATVIHLTVVGALVGATLRPYLTLTVWGFAGIWSAAAYTFRRLAGWQGRLVRP
jgi:hypothetical protein